MEPRKTTAHITVRLNPKLKADVGKAAADDHRSISSLVKVLLSDHCKRRGPSAEDRPLPKGVRK
jgi:hypothetical protein